MLNKSLFIYSFKGEKCSGSYIDVVLSTLQMSLRVTVLLAIRIRGTLFKRGIEWPVLNTKLKSWSVKSSGSTGKSVRLCNPVDFLTLSFFQPRHRGEIRPGYLIQYIPGIKRLPHFRHLLPVLSWVTVKHGNDVQVSSIGYIKRGADKGIFFEWLWTNTINLYCVEDACSNQIWLKMLQHKVLPNGCWYCNTHTVN